MALRKSQRQQRPRLPPKIARRKQARRKAAEMAGREIDRLGDQTATSKERAQRKRSLIKGPREFRGLRRD